MRLVRAWLQLRPFLTALGAVAVMAGARLLLDPLLGEHHPFVLFFAAVFFAAWSGGWRPGALALGAGLLTADFLFIHPRGELGNASTEQQVGMLAYLVVGAATVALIEGRRRALVDLERRVDAGTAELVVATDRGEQALARMRAVFSAAADGLILSDGHGNLMDWNPAALRMHGLGSADEVRQNLVAFGDAFVVSPPGGAPLPLDQWQLARLMRGEAVVNCELVLRRTDSGRELVVCYNGARVPGAGAVPDLLVLTLQDVTARKRDEADRADHARTTAARAAVAVAIARPGDLRSVLGGACDALVVEFGAALVRVWTLDAPGEMLDLRASAGLYTHLDGAHARVPVGRFKIGQIAQERRPHQTNRVADDPRVPEKEWVARERLVAFAGYPLMVEGRLVGVLALFSRQALSETAFDNLAGAADLVAQCVDRKRAEEALRESEERFRSIFEHAATGIGITDPAGRFVQCNPAYCAVLGRTEDELRAADLAALIHPDDRAENMALLRRLGAGEIPSYELENRFLHKSGPPRWVHKWVTALRDGAGRTKYLMALVTDVTERRRAEDGLRASETRFRLLVDGVRDHALFMLDPEGRVATWNTGAERLKGYRAEEVVGRHYALFFPPEDGATGTAERLLAEARATGRAEHEGWRARRDGTRFWANAVLNAVHDADRLVGFAKVTHDLSERRRAEVLLTSVLDNVLDAVIGIDERGTVKSFNRAAERIFGFADGEVVGRNVSQLMPEPDRSRHDGYLANYLRTGAAKVIGIGREVTGRRKDGSTFPADLAVSEFWLDDRRYFTGVVRDISARRLLEDQYRQAQKMEAVGRLAGGIAHDFNNLLTVINGFSDVALKELRAGDPLRESLELIREAGERAAALTRQLLAFSRKQVLQPTSLDLNALLTGMDKMLGRLLGADVDLTLRCGPGLWSVRADAGQVEQVVMNLAVNARDAMPTGGKLTVETANVTLDPGYAAAHPEARAGECVRLAVTDTGCGMAPEVRAQIFEPFFTTKGEKGTGLGLATVFGIVKQSGGHVEVYSEVGVGTTFKVYLPRDREPEAAPRSGLWSKPTTRGSETILLAEDEDGVRGLAKLVLQRAGYTVLEARHGRESLSVCEAHTGPIHLLATDVVMPGMSGREVAERLKALRPQMKVLFLSGYTDDTVVRHGVLEADVAFLQKPFSPDALAQKVREVLDATP